jgi:acyl-CoA dehydrogenase
MDFEIPSDVTAFLDEVDQFIEDKIKPLEKMDDNIRFFDHRREDARTDWDREGLPRSIEDIDAPTFTSIEGYPHR